MKRSLLSLAILGSVLTASAQPMLVKDINPGTGGSFPARLTAFGNKLMFVANDGTNGFELWMMDSTADIAFNLNPAAANGLPSTPNRKMAVVGKYIYFPADNGTAGTELYKWDGTTTNAPMLAAEVMTGATGAGVDEVVALNDKVYFDANDGNAGEELWVYDTTTSMAMRLTDINVGASGSIITNITVYNGKLYFAASSFTTGSELYCYDPATNNTTLVLDIEAGGSSSPNNFMVYNGKLYFSAFTFANGRELYSYNGTNVQRLTDLVTGSGSGIATTASGTQLIAGLNGMIYLSGNDATSNGHLYRYDPATGLVSLIYRSNPTGNSLISNFATYNSKLYFSATNTATGSELWMYSGSGIPMMVADIRSGVNSSTPAEFCVVGKNLYFSAADSANGTELFKYYDSTLSVKNIRFEGEVIVYPNPANSSAKMDIKLQASEKLAIRLTDVTGRLVYSVPATSYNAGANAVNIPVADLAAGTYIYTICNEAGSMLQSGRLTKQ